MTFEEVTDRVNKYNLETTSKIYRVCPNPKTDIKGLNNYSNALKEAGYPLKFDPKPYSNNEDYFLLESNY
jgi:hypothetical protein